MNTLRLRILVALVSFAAPLAHAATITVNSTADPAGFNSQITIAQLSATITLRDAVNAVRNSGGTHTITFAPALAGQTIYLSQAEGNSALNPNQLSGPAKNLTIQGLTGNSGVTIARDPNGPLMNLFLCLSSDLTLTVNDLTFSGGDVRATSGWGGAFNIIGGANVSMNRCTLTNNKAHIGGAIQVRDSTLSITNCTIAGNQANDSGGGIFHLSGATITMTHTTVTNNSAGRGGGLYFAGGELLINTIVAGNQAFLQFGYDIDGNGSPSVSASSHHNLIGNAGSSGGLSNGVNGNIVGANPLLAGLTNNGGPTQTAALMSGSPALNSAAAGLATIDQRGVSRPSGPGADIGAFELVYGAPVITSGNSATFVTNNNGSFNVTATGVPTPTFSISGTLPAGVTFTPAGLLSGIPAFGTQGTYPLTITAANDGGQMTTQSFTLTVVSGAIVVTTAVDEDNGSTDPALGTGTSLREAVNFANAQSLPQAITFAPGLAGQSIDLTLTGDSSSSGASALRINKDLTIQGLTGNNGITIRRATSSSLRPILIYFDASLTVNDLTIADGLAQNGGGVFNLGNLRMNRCTLRNNTATFKGGALGSGGGGGGQQATLTNCTLANNTTQFSGGAIANDETSSMALTNVTIAANTTTNAHAGLDISGTVLAINTIVAGNKTTAGAASDIGGTFAPSSHHNLIGEGGSGGLTNGMNGNLVGVQNPKLGLLAANGGPTPTIALLNSPALDAGATIAGVTTDQRGVVRPQFGTPDIGAYEFNGTIESLTVTTTVDELDASSNPTLGTGTSLREALRYANSLSGAQTITFVPELAGQTVALSKGWNDASDASALRVIGQITLQGLTSSPGVIIAMAQGVQKRHLYVAPGGNLTVSHLTFTGGYGNDFGGSIWSQGSLTVRNCTFTVNSAAFEGGAIQSWGDSPLLAVENSTFSGNTSNGVAGAIDCGASLMTLRYVTITNNSATNGNALVIWKYQVTMVNTIIAGNANDGVGSVNGGSFNSAQSKNNLLGSGGSGGLSNGVNGNFIGVSANQLLLGSLGNNGGPTQTIPLLAGSVAIDSGMAIAGLTSDQRGTPRPQGPASDIGAFEFVYVAPAFTSANTTVFQRNRSNSFQVTASGAPPPAFALTGALPAGVTFTAAGLLSGNPASGTEGNYPLTITASNNAGQTATQSFTLGVVDGDLLVTTAIDEDNGSTNPALGTGTSLREAINFANTRSIPQTISFSPGLAGQSIDLTVTGDTIFGASALRINQNITIQGLSGNNGITIRRASSGDLRPFLIYFGATLTLNDLTIADGRASQGGGIYNFGTLRMNRCTLRNNSAASRGGGFNSGGGGSGQQVTLTNCTVANNQAPFAGGLGNDNTSVLSLTNVTVSANTSSFTNGTAGVEISGTAVLINTIIAGNTKAGGVPSDIAGTVAGSSHHNLIGTGGSGGLTHGTNGNIVGVEAENLRLGALGANGGPAQTTALLPGCPAIDAAAAVSGLTTDQRGLARPQGSAPDIGAFEFIPTPAAIPIVSPLGGAYENLVQVTISSTSYGTSIRYTLDGSDPTSSHGQTYSAPFTLAGNTTVKVIAYGSGWLDSPIASVAYSVLLPLPYWRQLHGLAANGSQDLAVPAGDGVANLLKYAFNMAPNTGDLTKPNNNILPHNGTAGLPFTEVDAQGRLVIEFVRRKAANNPGITYTVETGDNLGGLTPLNLSGATVVSIDDRWERVTIVDPTVSTKRFGRVRVQVLP